MSDSIFLTDGNGTLMGLVDTSYSGELVIPEYVAGEKITAIGYEAFAECRNLTSITIPDSVTSIGDQAFYLCENLTNITIPDSVTSISNGAFKDCYSLTSINIPNSATSIGDYAFEYCYSLTSINIPNSVTSIGTNAFYRCENLTNANIPNSITSISNGAFGYCENLTSIAIPDSVTSIGDYAFCGCIGLTSISIPSSVTSIGDYAFKSCENLTNITIPNSVTNIGDYAFKYCYSLTSINIPNSVTNIGDHAFEYCDNLTNINIPNSVTSIGDYAFRYCYSLTTIYVPDPDNLSPAVSSYNWPDGITFVKGKSILEQSIYNAFKRMWKHVNTKFSKKDHTHDDRYYQKSELANISNPNLLDNWYFGNPVNQRGKTEYTGAGYGIDRWRATAQSGKVLLLENAVRVSTSNDSTPGWFCQILENPTAFSGKTVTFSMLVTTQDASSWRIAFEDATTAGGSGNYAIEDFELAAGETALISVTKKIDVGVAVSLLQNLNSTEKYVDIHAAKLELGEGQTLAHQDADGNWVLNEIPDYAEELAKCQRYFYAIRTTGNNMLATAIANTTTNLLFAMPLPVPMRANPAASYSNLLYSTSGGSAGVAPTKVEPISTINTESALRTIMLTGSFTAGTPYALILAANGYLYLDANL